MNLQAIQACLPEGLTAVELNYRFRGVGTPFKGFAVIDADNNTQCECEPMWRRDGRKFWNVRTLGDHNELPKIGFHPSLPTVKKHALPQLKSGFTGFTFSK